MTHNIQVYFSRTFQEAWDGGNLVQVINVILVVKMQENTNTTTQSVIAYFNISKLRMNKVRKFAMKFNSVI